jgi:hypothetical protein
VTERTLWVAVYGDQHAVPLFERQAARFVDDDRGGLSNAEPIEWTGLGKYEAHAGAVFLNEGADAPVRSSKFAEPLRGDLGVTLRFAPAAFWIPEGL